MITITFLLVLAAFVVTIMSSVKNWPLWVSVMLLVLVELLRLIPAR